MQSPRSEQVSRVGDRGIRTTSCFNHTELDSCFSGSHVCRFESHLKTSLHAGILGSICFQAVLGFIPTLHLPECPPKPIAWTF
jgi:hypothetical protein